MSMKYVDEYRDPELAKRIAGEIARMKWQRASQVHGGVRWSYPHDL